MVLAFGSIISDLTMWSFLDCLVLRIQIWIWKPVTNPGWYENHSPFLTIGFDWLFRCWQTQMGMSMWRVPKAIVSLPLRGRSVRMRECTLSLYAILLERIQLTLMSKLSVSFFKPHYHGYISQLFSERLKLGPNFIMGHVAVLLCTLQNCILNKMYQKATN